MRELHVWRKIENISRTQHNNPDNIKKHRVEFDSQKHVNARSMSLFCEEMTKVRSLCRKDEVMFSENQLIWDFATEFIKK